MEHFNNPIVIVNDDCHDRSWSSCLHMLEGFRLNECRIDVDIDVEIDGANQIIH